MKFLELQQKLSDQLVFTANDIKKIDPNFYFSRLTEWQKKGYIKKVIKGYYIFSGAELNEIALFAVANRIYSPSYVSLESVFRYYNIIPEGVFSITSVSTRNTYEFSTDIGVFKYRKEKPSLFFGYKVIQKGKIKAKIAFLEKALLDYFYLNPEFSTEESIKGLRFNSESLFENLDMENLKEYLSRFHNKGLEQRINLFLKIIKEQ